MLCNNEITILPDIFDKMEHLKIVSVINNKLTVIPSTFAKMDKGTIISLSNNPVTNKQNTIIIKK
jgi:Leucine-rich repeat (LRR) protein